MSDQDAGERAHESTTLGRPGNFGLDPQSYTAQRLQHATPQHLHITSRRCFIGPIPEAWLSRHRKSWYQYRPHNLQTYASKTASFTAGESYSELRQLSGLDGATSGSGRHTLSFPQPSDANEESVDVEEEGTGNDGTTSRADQQGTNAEQVEDAKGKQSRRKDIAKGIKKIPAKLKSPKRKGEALSAPRSTGKSFVTANEFPNREDSRSTPPEDGQGDFGAPESPPSDNDPSNSSNEGNADHSKGTVDGAADSVDSTSSLLPHGDNLEGKDAKSKPTQADNNLQVTVTAASGDGSEGEAQGRQKATATETLARMKGSDGQGNAAHLDVTPDRPTAGSPSLRQLDPVSTGLVRFNLPADGTDEHPQAARKVSEARFMRSLRDLSKARAEPGQLLKAERMLVRVDATRQEVPAGYSENDSLRIETKLVEKWREYIVVCRRNPEEEEPGLVLRMEKTRVIPVLESSRSPKKPAHQIVLNPKTAKINMYSSLDKTIVMWAARKKETRIFLFRPRSFASSVEWYTFLHTALGWKRSSSLTVHVPSLNMRVEIEKPFEELDINDSTTKDADAAKHVAEGQAAQRIIDRAMAILRDSPSRDVIDAWAKLGERMGLAWKRYDRLEWVHGANEERMYGSIAMAQTHDLELRPKTHYPTQVHHRSLKKPPIEEPSAVEGFLIRLTSQKGQGSRFGRQFSKRLYYSTNNQYFCFSTPGKVSPPKPPHLPGADSRQTPKASELAEKLPKIYTVDPYPVADGQVSWLSSHQASKKKEHDQAAFMESERTVQALMDAEGYINLCHVAHIRKSRDGTNAPPPQREVADEHQSDRDSESDDMAEPSHDDATFEIKLRNGLVVRLQAYDKETRREWVKRLREIVDYWRTRTAEDMGLYREVRQTNLRRLDLDESMESSLGQFAEKWEVTRAVTSPELFNVCGISCCRAVTLSGVLYHKPRLHGTFKKCNVLLVHGRLLLFQATLRKRNGQEIPHIHHERLEAVDLRDTYVYSGLAVESELLYRNQTFDSNHPGHHALPRVYLEDRWTSTDEDTATCFVLWRSLRKSLFRASTEDAAGGAAGGGGSVSQRIARVSRLGTTGRAAVFKTRSRTERDRWVTSIGMEIERLQQGTDIRLVPKR